MSKIVHELHAVPFDLDPPSLDPVTWYDIEANVREVPVVTGPIVTLCSDGIERRADRNGDKIRFDDPLPDGVLVKAWRLP